MKTLNDIYLSYLDCLNRQAFNELGTFVGDHVEHNGRPFGLSACRDMLVHDVFYEFEHTKIRKVRSIIDKAAIERQLGR